MSDMSNYLEDAVLNHFFRNTATSAPVTVYLALYTTLPDEAGAGGTEVTGGAYARQAVTFGAPTTSGAARRIANSVAVTFPVATADWGTVAGWAVLDAAAAGNILALKALSPTQQINTNGQASFAIGALTLDAA